MTILILWYDHAGQPADDINSRRKQAPWYRRKRYVSIEDMIIAFRRTRITSITAAQATSDQFTPSVPTSEATAA